MGVLERVEAVVSRLEQRARRHRVVVSERRPFQGTVIGMVRVVLGDHPEGLRAIEVHRLVEQRLGQSVPYSTVGSTLSSYDEFERIGYGRYRCRAL